MTNLALLNERTNLGCRSQDYFSCLLRWCTEKFSVAFFRVFLFFLFFYTKTEREGSWRSKGRIPKAHVRVVRNEPECTQNRRWIANCLIVKLVLTTLDWVEDDDKEDERKYAFETRQRDERHGLFLILRIYSSFPSHPICIHPLDSGVCVFFFCLFLQRERATTLNGMLVAPHLRRLFAFFSVQQADSE